MSFLQRLSGTDLSDSEEDTDSGIGSPYNLKHNVHVNRDFKWLGDKADEMFVLKDKLGEGAYGVVHRAVHKEQHTFEIAIKQVFTGSETKESSEIKKEIDILQKLNNPYIVKYYGSYIKTDALFILMEIAELGSMRDVMKKLGRSLHEMEVAQVTVCCLKGLEYLHEQNIIHRDVKAANILLTGSGKVKLTDFGVSEQICNTLFAGTFVGTPLWMAPEVITKSKYNKKADIWSLGITIIEIADGYPPHSDMHPFHAMFKIPFKPPPTVVNPSAWSPLFNEFVAELLQKDYKKRPDATTLLTHSFSTTLAKGEASLKPLIAEARQAKQNPITNGNSTLGTYENESLSFLTDVSSPSLKDKKVGKTIPMSFGSGTFVEHSDNTVIHHGTTFSDGAGTFVCNSSDGEMPEMEGFNPFKASPSDPSPLASFVPNPDAYQTFNRTVINSKGVMQDIVYVTRGTQTPKMDDSLKHEALLFVFISAMAVFLGSLFW
mmetsp:Transcript_15396/g.17141  ORF Transcript_15396/g.17141 Transcript_15396/m.17141 type:complete len:489 (-) Transcript_15396:53-1519(-)